MKIVQRILSHGLLIAFIVAVFFVYLYRGELFPQWFGTQTQTEVAPAESSAAQAPGASDEQAQTTASHDAGQSESQAVTATETEPLVAAPDKPVVTEAASAPATASQNQVATADLPISRDKASEPAAAADSGGSGQDRPEESPAAAQPSSLPVADVPAVDEAAFQSQLDQARQLYWRRDLRAAEQAYRRLTESYPQRAEVWGELGNLYYSQREMVQAADVYYRAIELLIEQGDTGRARQMLGAMHQLDSDKARKLEEQLSQGE